MIEALCGLAEILGVLQLNVCAKCFVKLLRSFWLRAFGLSHRLLDTDNLEALRALANPVTSAIHFFLGPKPNYVGQFWFFHIPSFP